MADGEIKLEASIDTRGYEKGAAQIESTNSKLESSTRKAASAMDGIDVSSSKGAAGAQKFGSGVREAADAADDFGGKVEKSSSLTSVAMGAIGGVAASMASSVMDSLSGLTGDIIEASDSAQKFASTLQFAGIDDSKIQALTASTQKYADQTVYSISDIRNITAQLAANGVQGYDQLAEAAGNLNAVAGGNADTFASVGMVLTQTAGAGKLTTENWNQLADAIPGASGALQEAMKKNGAYTGNFRDAMADGQITAEEFNKAIMDLGMTDAAKEAATSTTTIEGALGNLEASAVGVGTAVLDAIKPAITGGMDLISGLLGNVSSGISAAIPAISSGLSQVGSAFMGAFGPATESIGGFVSGIKSQLGNVAADIMPQLQTIGDNIGTAFGGLAAGAVPIITSVIQSIVDRFSIMAPAITSVISSISGVFASLAPSFQMVGSIIGQVIGTISNVFNSVLAAVIPIITQLITNVANIITQNAPLIQQVITAIGTAVASLMPFIQQIGDIIINTLVPALQPLVDAITSMISAVLPVLLNLIQQLLPIFTEWATTIMSAVVPVIQDLANVVKGVIKVLTGIINFLTGVFTGNWQQAWDGIKQVASGIWDAINGLIQAAIDAVKAVITAAIAGIKANWEATWTAIKTVCGNTWNAIKSAVKSAINAVKSTIQNILNGIKSAWDSGWNAVKTTVQNTWNNMVSAVQSTGTRMLNFVKGIPDKIKGFFSGAAGWLVSAGRDIINGLINGVKGMIGSLVSTISNAAKSAVDAAKSFLHIGSPSKVFRDEIGQWIPAGISLGIDDEMPKTVKNFEGQLDAMVQAPTDLAPVTVPPSAVGVQSNTGPQNASDLQTALTNAMVTALRQVPSVRVMSDPATAAAWIVRDMNEELQRTNIRENAGL